MASRSYDHFFTFGVVGVKSALYHNTGIFAENVRIAFNIAINCVIPDKPGRFKAESDLKTRKTLAIVELLDHARLLSPGEVMKGGK
jgi:hypothetical protein